VNPAPTTTKFPNKTPRGSISAVSEDGRTHVYLSRSWSGRIESEGRTVVHREGLLAAPV
jgi:hypothetical protein